jgi:two-component system chemotaxis response regulator CheB
MAIKVLVVDDSSFFRRRVSEIINADPRLEVIDVAVNGKEAVEKAKLLKPDVITMDIEMPVMDGISAVREIMKVCPTPTLMFSSLTHDGAKATLDALDAGALDFLPKKFEDIARNRDEAVSLLQKRIAEIARKKLFMRRPALAAQTTTLTPRATVRAVASTVVPAKAAPVAPIAQRFKATGKKYQLTAIGTSTGGPVALQKILTAIPANYPHPIILVQHMPATFTAAFASRLNNLCKIQVKEAADGDVLKPGCAYLAPGGRQMTLEGRQKVARLRVSEDAMGLNYAPCVDLLFTSIAKAIPGGALGVLLTGMGSDGCEGARLMKESGSVIWSQDKESCVVYGMPQAVEKAGISSEVFDIKKMGENIAHEISA